MGRRGSRKTEKEVDFIKDRQRAFIASGRRGSGARRPVGRRLQRHSRRRHDDRRHQVLDTRLRQKGIAESSSKNTSFGTG